MLKVKQKLQDSAKQTESPSTYHTLELMTFKQLFVQETTISNLC